VHEQGVSNPRFLRFTQNVIPLDSSSLQNCGLPLCALWQPLADLPDDDEQVIRSDSLPFRCSRCGAYINFFFKFVESGRKLVCNICGMVLDTPEFYQSDRANKSELHNGTYEFKAPSEYSNRPSHPPLFLFIVDISTSGVELGLMAQVVSSIQAILDYLPHPERTNIGVMAFDIGIHLFRVNSSGELIEVIVNDIEDPFIPDSPQSVCLNVKNNREELDLMLAKLVSTEFKGTSKLCLSPAGVVFAVKQYLLKARGGKVLIFASQAGGSGKMALASKVDTKFINTEKDKGYLPAENFINLAHECSAEDVSVDVFACAHQPINASSYAALCSLTGGDFYHFPAYRPEADGEKVYYLITRILTRVQGTQVMMRARCSNGLSVDYYIGKFKRRGPVEMEIASIDADKTLAVVIKYDEKLNESNDYYVQCAMLYTDFHGNRVIRICNGKIMASKNSTLVLKSADVDACNAAFLKISANKVFESSLNEIRDNWHSSIIKVLITHRTNLGDQDFSKILVPETLRLLPLNCNCSLKLPGLTVQHVPTDIRLSSIHQILGLPLYQTKLLCYPKLYSLHDLEDQTQMPGTLNNENLVILPKLIGSSLEFLKSSGVYLLNNGEFLMLFIGKEVSPNFIQQVWGIESFEDLFEAPDYWPLGDQGNELSHRVLAVVEEVRRRNPGSYSPLHFFFEGHSDSALIKKFLLEDNNSAELAYGDFLMRLHKVVVNKMRKDS
jgi:protein transport protein SEC24